MSDEHLYEPTGTASAPPVQPEPAPAVPAPPAPAPAPAAVVGDVSDIYLDEDVVWRFRNPPR